jgi:hypothetical protein
MTAWAPASGSRAASAGWSDPSGTDGAAAVTGDQVSKSVVAKVRPSLVLAKSWLPSGENHTCPTGPVAAEASASSTDEEPTFRQSARIWADATPAAANASQAAAKLLRTVPL